MMKFIIILLLVFKNQIYSQSKIEIDSIKNVLENIRAVDQDYRYKILDKIEKFGNNSIEVKKTWDTIALVDSFNLQQTEEIIEKYGWLGIDKVGFSANQTLFLVMQHSKIEKQIKFLPLLRISVKEGKSSPINLAYMEDKVSLHYNKYQIYGSQFFIDSNGNRILETIYNPKELNQRRTSIGLTTIEEYCNKLGIKYEK